MSNIQAAQELADDCRTLARDVMNAFVRKPQESLGGAGVLFLARATTALESVQMLAGAGLNADATSVSRTVIELCFELRFIAESDTEKRFELFFGHEAVRDWLEAKAIAGLHGGLTEKAREAMNEVEARYDAVKAQYPKKYDWCSSLQGFDSLRKRTVSVGGQHLYDLAYAEGCSTSHAGPRGLRHAYSAAEDPQNIKVTFLVGRSTPSGQPITLACLGFIVLVGTVINLCELQAQFDDRHAELLARLNGLPIEGDA
jgi:hypothetical protein